MKTAVNPSVKSKTFTTLENLTLPIEKEKGLVNFKFYQKLFVFFLAFSTILIFPESPKELENICESYNSRKICNVW